MTHNLSDIPEWDGKPRLDEVDRRLGLPFKAFMIALVGRMRGKKGKSPDLARWWKGADRDKRARLREAIECAMQSPFTIEEIIKGK